jgi:hypothetical protein
MVYIDIQEIEMLRIETNNNYNNLINDANNINIDFSLNNDREQLIIINSYITKIRIKLMKIISNH